MARSANQKRKLLYVMKLLLERSDEKHPISMPEILSALAAQDISAERKSVSDDIRLLRQYGLPVVCIRRGRQTAYSLKNTP